MYQNEIDILIARNMIIASGLSEDFHCHIDMQKAANEFNKIRRATENSRGFFMTLDNRKRQKEDLLLAFVLTEADVPEYIDNSMFPVSFFINFHFTVKELDHLIKLIKR